MEEMNVKSIELLAGSENYQLWKFQIKIFPDAHKLDDIAGGVVKLEHHMTPEKKSEWKKKDGQAKKLVITTIEKSIITHSLSCETSHNMMEKLEKIFERNTTQTKCDLLEAFYKFDFDKNVNVASNISKLENIVYKLKSIGQNLDEQMVITRIISTLPSSFRHFMSAWESSPENERDLTNLMARLINEEKRLNVGRKEEYSGICFLFGKTTGSAYSWIVDSGCTSHATNNQSLLTNVHRVKQL